MSRNCMLQLKAGQPIHFEYCNELNNNNLAYTIRKIDTLLLLKS